MSLQVRLARIELATPITSELGCRQWMLGPALLQIAARTDSRIFKIIANRVPEPYWYLSEFN
jgi:type IV secretory pathway TrbD component